MIVERYLPSDSEKLYQIIKENIHPRFPNVALKKWITLSKTLFNLGENISSYISKFSSYSELYSFIQSIPGYGQKTGGLLLRFIYDTDGIVLDDEISHIPIDRRDIEISFRNEIIPKMDLNQTEIEWVSRIWIEASKKVGVSPSKVDQYLWVVGTTFCTKKNCLFCPLKSTCRKK